MKIPKLIKNSRGDIPITILVIGIFAVCTLAIASFFYSSIQINKSFTGINLMEKANIDIEKGNLENYYLDKNVTKFKPSLSTSWTKEVKIFSVQYYGEP